MENLISLKRVNIIICFVFQIPRFHSQKARPALSSLTSPDKKVMQENNVLSLNVNIQVVELCS